MLNRNLWVFALQFIRNDGIKGPCPTEYDAQSGPKLKADLAKHGIDEAFLAGGFSYNDGNHRYFRGQLLII